MPPAVARTRLEDVDHRDASVRLPRGRPAAFIACTDTAPRDATATRGSEPWDAAVPRSSPRDAASRCRSTCEAPRRPALRETWGHEGAASPMMQRARVTLIECRNESGPQRWAMRERSARSSARESAPVGFAIRFQSRPSRQYHWRALRGAGATGSSTFEVTVALGAARDKRKLILIR